MLSICNSVKDVPVILRLYVPNLVEKKINKILIVRFKQDLLWELCDLLDNHFLILHCVYFCILCTFEIYFFSPSFPGINSVGHRYFPL